VEKIKLTPRSKEILFDLQSNRYSPDISDEDMNDIISLIEYGFIIANKFVSCNKYTNARLTSKGIAYLHNNPKLKNPSIWDDKKYLITTLISLISIIISIIALYKSI
jgi:hypothetical protein